MGTLSERSKEFILKREKTKKQVILIGGTILGVIVLFMLSILLYNMIRTKTYNGYEKLESFDRADGNTVKYMPYEGALLKYSRDGASAIDKKGKVLWNGSYEMKSPMIDVCGKNVVIADNGGKEVYVYNGSDSGTVLNMDYPVSMVRIASQGVIAVVLDDSDSNIIRLYNPYDSSNSLLVEVPTNISTDGYPVDIALSPDGKSLVTSYVYMNGSTTESNICFYNFSEVGQDKNRVVGGCNFVDSFANKLEFVDDDTLCIFLNNGYSLYSNMKQPKEIHTEIFNQEIRSVMTDRGHVGFILDNSNMDSTRTIKVIDATGKDILNQEIEYDYDKVSMANDEIIFSTSVNARIVRFNGSVKLDCDLKNETEYFLPGKASDIYYVIDANAINRVKLCE